MLASSYPKMVMLLVKFDSQWRRFSGSAVVGPLFAALIIKKPKRLKKQLKLKLCDGFQPQIKRYTVAKGLDILIN